MSDPHSCAQPTEQGATRHLSWSLAIDPTTRQLRATARWTLDTARSGPLDLDTRGLSIASVTDADGAPLPWAAGPTDPVLGQRLRIERHEAIAEVVITYTVPPEASALMWLDPAQTSSGQPFLLTQCQAIHARSLLPCQDTPQVRFTYEAVVELPADWTPVMSASPGVPDGTDTRWRFTMAQPIPSYLLALAAGRLESRELGPRTRVWAEPAVLEAAAWEFADADDMLCAAEALMGPYPWERYDFIVLPPSFPLGGMENPRMTFLTPTLIAGDRSLVSVLTHELAHSWSGNLVTSASNEHFWLNEGWTVYAERRILEVLEGTERSAQEAVLGRLRLDEVLAERMAAGAATALTYDQTGLDPDEEFSLVPYEKGFLLLVALERAVGRTRFDAFVAAYLERFAFTSITTDDFVAFLSEALPDHGVDLAPWLHGEGLPADAPTFTSERLMALDSVLARAEVPVRPQSAAEQLYVLARLRGLDAAAATMLGADWGLADTDNQELASAWLALALHAGVDVEDDVTHFVCTVGRTKLLRPVFAALVATGRRQRAAALLEANSARLHGSTRQALAALL